MLNKNKVMHRVETALMYKKKDHRKKQTLKKKTNISLKDRQRIDIEWQSMPTAILCSHC